MITDLAPTAVYQIEAEPSDRRSWPRYPCALKGLCQPVAKLESGNCWPIRTYDISEGGIGVLMCRRFEPGTLLAIALSGAATPLMTMPLARICRVVQIRRHWFMGCTWADELDRDDLRQLLFKPKNLTPLPTRPLLRRRPK